MRQTAELTARQHVVREDAPGSGRCVQCPPFGSCLMLVWADGVLAGGSPPYPQGPVAPLDLRAA